jgi:hypothetical protein
MKFTRCLALSLAVCLPLAIACGSAENPNFFEERAGAKNSAIAGRESASAGLSEGGASERGGTGGTLGGVAGRPSTGSAGKNGAGSSGGGGMTGGGAGGASASAGSAGTAAGAGGARAGSGGSAGASSGSGGSAGASSGSGGGAAASAGVGGTAGVNAGAGGTAGTSAGAGGSAAGNGGDSGWNGWGGWNGWSGSNGAGGASVCPASPPQKSEICDVSTPNSCFYAGQACSCLPTSSGGINPSKRWACYGDGAACPDTKPVAGASCKASLDAECPYPGNDFCVCASQGNNLDAHWVCQAGAPMCAPNKPPDDNCSAVKTCSWGTNKDVACFCNGTRWGCEGGF